MNSLCFNTTGTGTQFALNLSGQSYFLEIDFSKHSETFFPLLDEFLKKNNVTLQDIDYFGVVNGPGSFTGIRIGLSVIKMFAYVDKKQCVVVNALKVLAYNIFERQDIKDTVCSVINAGAGNLYYQLFKVKNKALEEINTPKICTFEQFDKIINKFENVSIVYCENNEQKYRYEALQDYITDFTAKALDMSVQNEIQLNNFVEYKQIMPLYIRNSQAESFTIDEQKYTINEATGNDIDMLYELEQQIYDDNPWSKQSLQDSFNNTNYKCWIIKNQDTSIGYVSVMDLGDEYEILRIVVSQKARQQGVAKRLLEFLFKEASQYDVESIVLEVNEFNYPARLLYEKNGFEIVGKREKYYHKGQDGYIMRKKL